MTLDQFNEGLLILALAWLGFGLIMYFCFLYSKAKIKFIIKYIKTQRLCGYHLTGDFRSRSLAVVDGRNCEICMKEKETKSNV